MAEASGRKIIRVAENGCLFHQVHFDVSISNLVHLSVNLLNGTWVTWINEV